jgi:hypothetical protein
MTDPIIERLFGPHAGFKREEYRRLRAKGYTPQNALRQAQQAVAARVSHDVDYGDWCIESTDFDGKSGPYGGYRCRTSDGLPPWLDLAAREAGWDPAHLSLRITADIDEWHEFIDDQMRNMGFDLVEAKGIYPSREWRGEFGWDPYDANRPEKHSVLVDLSGPRDRPDRYWLTYTDDVWGKPTGMSKSVAADWEHRFRVERAERMVEWARKCVGDCPDIQPYAITVEVLWRGEVVGEGSCGGFDMEWKGSFDAGPTFEEQILDAVASHGLFDEAWDNAKDWAEEAVADAKAKAAEIIESIALLPEAAHQVVREQFDRKVINMTAKKEA